MHLIRTVVLLVGMLAFSVHAEILGPQGDIPAPSAEQRSLSDLSPNGTVANGDIGALLERAGVLMGAVCRDTYPRISVRECFDKLYHAIMSSRDPHSTYMNPKEFTELMESMQNRLKGIGVQIHRDEPKLGPIVIVNVFEETPAARAGLRRGDVIVSVDGIPSTKFKDISEAVGKIKGEPGTKVVIGYLREGNNEPVSVTVERADITIPNVTTEVLREGQSAYGYVKVRQFSDNTATAVRDAVEGLLRKEPRIEGFVFDLAGNPGGSLVEVVSMADLFLEAPGEVIVTLRDNDGIDLPYSNPMIIRTPGDITNGKPILVIVDGASASAAEIFSGAMKFFGRAVVAGERTWGKGSFQGVRPLVDGHGVAGNEILSGYKFTEGEYLIGSPTRWMSVQCLGVTPDLPYVSPDRPANAPKEARHECDLAGAIETIGSAATGSTAVPPIESRNPALYVSGKRMLEAYKIYAAKKAEELKRK